MYQVVKRDGSITAFNLAKIGAAITKAFEATHMEYNPDIIDLLALRVTADYHKKIQDGRIAVEDIQHIVWRLKYRNIGILITDHNVQETLSITDRAYLLFEGRILFHGTPEELAVNPIVRKNYLGENFVLRRFKPTEEDEAAEELAREGHR